MSVTLETIRKEIKAKLEVDENLRYVDVLADSLDDALSDAAVQLDCDVNKLEYEILERGSNGFVGMMKKNWKIRAYEISQIGKKTKKKVQTEETTETEVEVVEEILDKDGEYFVRKFESQIYLKVDLPIGEGKPVDFKEVYNSAKIPAFISVEENDIRKAVKDGTNGEYVMVGVYKHNAAEDAQLVVDLSNDDMHAYATVTEPSTFGSDVSVEQIKKALEVQGVCINYEDDKIKYFVDHPEYGIAYEVVTAPAPVDGKNAYMEYKFETDKSKRRGKETDSGQVDYKELNIIENVIEGQPLAVKIPPEKGKNGKTLKGVFMQAKDGKDINMPLGKNVYVDKDGVTICAQVNGQVLLIADKICVEPVHLVEGDVCNKTGNINFLGSVVVKGSVQDGYDITASGNIEIGGTVGKCHLKADGDIFISQGVVGGDVGEITAKGSVWARFIQNTKLDVGEFLLVTDGIVNSDVVCDKKILVTGTKKQTAIKGGHLFAKEAVYTKDIGSSGGGVNTIIEVGVDPKAKIRMVDLQQEQNGLLKKIDELELNIDSLENTKKVRKRLPPDKEAKLLEMQKERDELLNKQDEVTNELTQIQEHLRDLKSVGKVSASGMVYAGSVIYVRDVNDDVRNDIKGVTFYFEDSLVRRGKYEAPDEEDLKRVPNGYAAN